METSKEQERVAHEEWLPQLKLAVQEAQQCLEDCKRVRGLVSLFQIYMACFFLFSVLESWISFAPQNAAVLSSRCPGLAFY